MISLLKYLRKKDWLFLLLSIALIVLQVYLELKMPDYTKELTTIVQIEADDMAGVWRNGGLMLACAAGSMASSVVCSYLVASIASSLSFSLRQALFAKISSFSNKEMHSFHIASLITRTTNDVVQVQNFMAMGVSLLVKSPIMAVWAIAKISLTQVSWTVATAICLGVIFVDVFVVIITCLPKFRRIQKLTDDLNARARENITGVRVIRAFNAEEYQGKKYEAVNKTITDTNLFTARVSSTLNPVLTLAMNGLILAIYWIGAILINNIKVDPATPTQAIAERVAVLGNMVAFSQYAIQVIMSFLMLVFVFIILPRVLVSANRIKEVLHTEPTILDGEETSLPKGDIVFDHVSFSYAGDEHYVLRDVDFTIKEGETVAFIGATGCGKTTVVNLLMRYFDVGKGNITIGGKDIRTYRLDSLRKAFSYAPQKASLFRGDIASNVTYGSKEKDEAKMEKALSIAQCDFVSGLEKGVHNEVAQGGSNYSGGQKQRLSIARAVYKDAPVFVFDDTFSALDYKTDMLVRKAIKKNLGDRTVIIVAQRIGTIKNADRIIVMDKGHVADIGTHEELLKNSPIYREIASSQLEKEEL